VVCLISAYANCSANSFQCGVGGCINSSKTCDGNWDCRDGSDESKAICGESVRMPLCHQTVQIFTLPSAYKGEGGNMQSGCNVCTSVCHSVIIDRKPIYNRPGAHCNLGLIGGGTTEVLILKHRKRVSRKCMNCIPAFWLSTPNLILKYPQSKNLGNLKQLLHSHTYP